MTLDIQATLLAQYSNSPNLVSLIYRLYNAINPKSTIDNFYKNVMNPVTATGWGLDVWGRIVGIDRIIKAPMSDDYLGFEEQNNNSGNIETFNNGYWYNGVVSTGNYAMTDDLYRKVIFAKAMSNISNGSIPDLNKVLTFIYGDRGYVYVVDHPANNIFGFEEQGETPLLSGFNQGFFYSAGAQSSQENCIVICHSWDLTAADATLLQTSGTLPRTAGKKFLYRKV